MPRDYLPLRWWTERDKWGNPWSVTLTSDDLHQDIQCRLGLTLCGEHGGSVLIWAGQPRYELLDTALHEIAHVHHWADKPTRTVGEQAIRVVIPRIVETLCRQGWTPPPLPDGWRSLAAHARHVRYGRQQRDE